ncbi:MAG: glycosyltransferase [Verrucomicrobiota bacterium]
MRVRRRAWLVALLGLLASGAGYVWATPAFDAPGGPRTLWFFLMGCFGLAAVFLHPVVSGRWGGVSAIWIPAILARLVLLPAAPSDDVNRYLWEGKLVATGISPYAHTADAPEWREHRDAYWEAMNHKDKPTAYPPLALGIFALAGKLWYHPMAFKLGFVLADLATLAGVLALLRRRGMSEAHAGFYALNPLVLVAYAGEAHFDALMVAALVWAVVAGGRWLPAALAALSGGIKWITLPLLLFFRGRRHPLRWCWSAVLAAGAALLLPALPFLGTLPDLWAGLTEFGSTRSFNGPVFALLHDWLRLPRAGSLGAVAALFVAILFWRWWRCSDAPLDAQIRWVLGGLVLLSPTVHFWYLAWLLPFVCLRPTLPWVLLSLSSAVYFQVWTNQTERGFWGLSGGEMLVFWGPFGLAALYELWSTRAVGLRGPSLRRIDAPTVGVVVPTLNAEACLGAALGSVADQSDPADAVVVADGGSGDRTAAIAEQTDLPLRWLVTEPGRGHQILAGVEALETDWVLVLHADARLPRDAVARLKRAVAEVPEAVAGALGQRFDSAQPELLLIEVLNDLRACLTRTAFGDQMQFFRRAAVLRYGLIPDQPLMEDVESSWRARTRGEFLFLNHPGMVAHGKWERRFWLKRFRLVFGLMLRYRWRRRRGPEAAAQLSEALYVEYYGKIPSAVARSRSSTVSTS